VDTLGTQLATQDTQRLAAWATTLETTASRIGTQAETQARSTVEEVARLVQAASDAPRAAAEVVAQLRDKLSESLARDNAMLDERNRLMHTLNTLLGAVQHTATEQKAAIDRMVASTAAWLDQAGARFTEQLHTESARMENMAAQLSGSAADVASLGDAFGTAVELFTHATGQAVAQLQCVEQALAKSSARSDDQLAYYVAQARELIDLSLLAQKQTVDELQRLARPLATHAPAPAASTSTAATAEA
jgi:predicted nuclease with TOPRIM domain